MIIMYSAGLPILNFVGAIYCFVAFWVDKVSLLRFAKKPPQYDAALVKAAVKTLPFAVLLHVGLGLWLFANQRILPSHFPLPVFEDSYNAELGGDTEAIHKIWWEGSKSLDDYKLKITERIYSFPRAASIWSLLALAGLTSAYTALFVFASTISVVLPAVKAALKSKTVEATAEEDTYLENMNQMPNGNSYLMQNNPVYLPAYKALHEVSRRKSQNGEMSPSKLPPSLVRDSEL
jgi:hypothetical protein